MPYIKPERRPAMDEIVDLMIKHGVKADGDLNYVLFKLCKHTVSFSYNNLKNFRGELHECADEIKRRFMDGYEDGKIVENGDVV